MLARGPVSCGSTAAYLSEKVSDFALFSADAMEGIATFAHLYNAVQCEGGIEIAWPNMEALISIHGPQRMFTGEAPMARSKYWRKYSLSMRSCALDVSSKKYAHAHRTRDVGNLRSLSGG